MSKSRLLRQVSATGELLVCDGARLLPPINGALLLLVCAVSFFSCRPGPEKRMDPAAGNPLFELLPAEKTGIGWKNTVVSSEDMNIAEYNYFYNGGGVAAADFNNDGLTDLYFTGNQVSGKLYLNRGNLRFEDVTEKAGLRTENWGTGVAVADVNGDGRPDMYISYAGYADPGRRKHQLFINKGIGADGIPVFADEAEQYGLADTSYTTQACFFDFDRDGDLDLLLVNHYRDKTNPNFPKPLEARVNVPGICRLYRNDRGHFTDISQRAGIREDGYGLGVCISDINQDGWPDIYIAKDFIFDDALYINNGNGGFTESLKKYIQHSSRFSMGCDISDFNNDGYPDIVTADMLPDSNYRQKMMNTAMNNDRFNYALSLGYTPQYSRNMLQMNNGPNAAGQYSFSEIGQLAGIYKTDWSWSPLFADFDNDGWKDLFVSNGIPRDITNNDFISYRDNTIRSFSDYALHKRELLDRIEELIPVAKSNFLFRNQGDLRFADMSSAWGLGHKGFSNGAVYADLDNDGDLDLVTNNLNDYPSVYRNTSDTRQDRHFIRCRLTGPFAIGAKLQVDCRGRKQFLEHEPVRGFQSCQDPIEHFGLGRDTVIDTLSVVWLDGRVQELVNVKADQLVSFDHKNAQVASAARIVGKGSGSGSGGGVLRRGPGSRVGGTVFRGGGAASKEGGTVFTDVTETAGIDFTHVQRPFEDFNFEPLLPHRFSREGPYVAVADVDGNGLEDVWVGGPAKVPGKLFLQQRGGKFLSKDLPDPGYEDMGGLFFDANGDGFADLYVVSGGNSYNANSAPYQDRLYINDGKGNFKRDVDALPVESSSGSCVVAADLNKDGAPDLFVGGRVVPGSYSLAPNSYILQNDGKGRFRDVTSVVCPELMKIGMVTSAIWSDFDKDGWPDLIVTGEWMPVCFFKNDHGILKRWMNNPAVDSARGWWFSIAEGDFDKDGDMDYVVGNLGLNNKFGVSPQTPVSVYTKDFDGNGRVEPILSYFLQGREYPVADRDQIAYALPSIKKKSDTYGKFAQADFGQLFSGDDLRDAQHLSATEFRSVYIENKGNGKFVTRPLPVEAQVSVVQSIQVGDFDGDGNLDMVVAGNYFSPDFMTGRYDASHGLLLKGDGKGRFVPLPASSSGIFIDGDARSSTLITIGHSTCLLALVNSGKLRCFKLNRQK